jgi:hypothetical protein
MESKTANAERGYSHQKAGEEGDRDRQTDIFRDNCKILAKHEVLFQLQERSNISILTHFLRST